MTRSLFALWLLPASIAAYLQVSYPFNLQLPPVALVGESYEYQIAPTTFATDSDNLQYSLVGNPTWLSLDSNSRTLSGTPSASDVGEINFKINAAGSNGAFVDMDSKLMVAKENGPDVKGNVTQVLATSGLLSGPKTINIGPSKPIDITFPWNTFASNGWSPSYYALLSDHTPLPAWISFDGSSLHFTGTTPSITSTQSFDILLIASQSPGYAGSSLSFTLVISNHQFLFQPYAQTLNLEKRQNVYIDLKSTLLLDGVAVLEPQIQSVDATLPSWLKLDKKTSIISGDAPSGTMSQDISVNATDQFGDVAQLNLHILFKSDLFASEIGQVNATIGEKFEYAIPQGVLSSNNEKLSVDLASLSRYLQFDPSKATIYGTITQDFPAQKVQCILTAVSSDDSQKDTQTFQIVASNSTESGTASVPAGTASNADPHHEDNAGQIAGIIIGSIIGAICGILLLFGLVICLRRRKQRKSYASPKLPRSPKKSDISRPMFIPLGYPHVDVDHDQEDLENGKGEHDYLMHRASEKPPMLDLDLQADDRDDESLTDSIGDADTRILDTFEESSWGFQNDTAPSQHPCDSMRIPTEQLAESLRSSTFRKHRRRATTVYHDQIHRSSGLPVNRRITGMGHGRQTYSPSRSNTNFSRSSLRRPPSTSSYTTTRCTSTFSTAPSTAPQRPVARQQPRVTTPVENRRSIRVVPASTRSSLVDRPMDVKRDSYIRNRASNKSPFFSAAGSRASSSTYKGAPAFMSDAPARRNTIVRPDDDVVEGRGKEMPSSSKARKPSKERIEARRSVSKPSVSPVSETSPKEFPGSLRQNRVTRPYTSAGIHRDRVEKSYARPDTTIAYSSSEMPRRASTRDSLRAYSLKSRLNDLTGSEIFKDADLSDSVYTDEEDEIEEAEKRVMVKPGDFVLPPLQIDTRRRSKRNSAEKKAEKQKRTSKGETKRDLKRTSERDPTPFYSAYVAEHGGKENMSSTYSLGARSTPARADTQSKTKATASPERPKTARQSQTATDRKSKRISKTPSQPVSNPKERHSRKSLHSRSASLKKTHSRGQSTAYPFFDSVSRPTSTTRPSSSKLSLMTRDLSGNLTFYGAEDEEPTVEELRSSSIGFRTSNGRINSNARRSRLASLHESSQFATPSPPPKSSKRATVQQVAQTQVRPAGLGLFPVDVRAEMCVGRERERERTPLGALGGENVSRMTPEGESGLDGQKGRQQGWGSLKSMVGKGGRLVSGGYWDKQGREDKVFL
ncbi:hypothetical protein HBI04_111550 [Parastagonospora nodorum]|nr:hypothetical protein HBI03_204440 [Parastagonospora nodorum]KAH4276644.1 hypothetical protein HBI04_111550 [Parastagonospora nodorum]KAH5320362.1 hypothetical protein HBI50_114800 [Parastagonospora nodorum]